MLALKDLNTQSELLHAKTIEFTCTGEGGAESIRKYVTESTPLPISCVQPRPRLVSAPYPPHSRHERPCAPSNTSPIPTKRPTPALASCSRNDKANTCYSRHFGTKLTHSASSPKLLGSSRNSRCQSASTVYEKRSRSVDTEEGDSTYEGQLPEPENDQFEPEVDLPESEYDQLKPLDDTDSDEGTNNKDDSSGLEQVTEAEK